jgi:prepilin-type N-terminal cleavage/methylation domain-containing protein
MIMNKTSATSARRGFSMVEVLVATALLALLFIGVLRMLDASSRTTKIESALVDTQENVRFAAYHVLRHARMVGGARIPMAVSSGWAAGQIISDTATTATTTLLGTVSKDRASDVLVLVGFYEMPMFRFPPEYFNIISSVLTVPEYEPPDSTGRLLNPLDGYPAADAFAGNGVVFFTADGPVIAEVTAGGSISGSGFARQMTLPFVGGTNPWNGFVEGGYSAPIVDQTVFQAGILSPYAYWVEDGTLWRRRFDASAGTVDESVAVNIGGFQVSLGIDTIDDNILAVDTWTDAPTPANVAPPNVPIAMRIAILGRTQDPVMDWAEPVSTFTEVDPGCGSTLAGVVDRSRKWRTIEVTATLRNYIL